MPSRRMSLPAAKETRGEQRILAALRAGFAGQARTAGQTLNALRRTNEALGRVGHRFADLCAVVGDLSTTVDRLAQGTAHSMERLTEIVGGLARSMEVQGRRIEDNNRLFAENNNLIAENNRRIEENNRHIEEQGVRLEAIGRRIDENTAAIRENTAAIVRLAEAIRRTAAGDGQPGSAGA